MKVFQSKKREILALVMLILMMSVSISEAQTVKALSFGTSSMGSAFYTLSVVISNVITKHSGISVTVEPVGGSDATLRGIGAKKVEIGMVNANSAVDALTGAGSYSKAGKIPISLIAQGQDSLRQIVVRADSGIKTPKDLSGKKFKLFVIEGFDQKECREMIEKFLQRTGKPDKEITEGRHSISDPHHGIVDVYWKGKYIWGVLDLDDVSLRSKYLKLFEANLEKKK